MNTEEQKKKPDLIKRSSTYKLIIPEEVERIIRYLCQKVPNVEWSGVLFFTHEGSFENNDLVLTCKDIYVMDIGVSTYTEFDMSPDVISYMAMKPELLDMQCALVHSHNNMATFFSGTDTATLKEEGNDRNHFLSLIVNNEGTYTAAVTRKINSVRTITESYGYNSFNDELKAGVKTYTEESEFIEYYMLDIVKEGKNYSFKEIDDRLSEIRKRKESEKKSKTWERPPYNQADKWKRQDTILNLFDSFEDKDIPETVEVKEDKKTVVRANSKEDDINIEDLNNVLCQLITGNVVIKDYKSFNLDGFVEKEMENLFNERFGNSKVGLQDYETWAEQFCEFLIFNVEPEIHDGMKEAQWMSDFSKNLLVMLESLKENKYIESLKSIIAQWII